MNWAFPFAIRVTAGQTAICLPFGFLFVERFVNFTEFNAALFDLDFLRVLARHVDELHGVSHS